MSFLSRHLVLDTRSVDVARGDTVMFANIRDYRPRGMPDAFRLCVASVVVDGLRFSAVTSTGHSIDLVDDEGVTLLAPQRGAIATEAGRQCFDARPGALILPRPGARRTHVSGGFVGLVAQLPMARLQAAAAANPEDAAALRRARTDGLAGAAGACARLARQVRHIVEEVDAPASLLAAPRAARAAGQLLTEMLLEALGAAAPAPHRPAGLRQVERAEQAIRARLGEELSVAALAGELGVSTRALQLAFQAHRGATPRAVIARLRLEAARERLLGAQPGETVTDLVFECGVTHPGRFAARYRLRYGESPSETLARRPRRG